MRSLGGHVWGCMVWDTALCAKHVWPRSIHDTVVYYIMELRSLQLRGPAMPLMTIFQLSKKTSRDRSSIVMYSAKFSTMGFNPWLCQHDGRRRTPSARSTATPIANEVSQAPRSQTGHSHGRGAHTVASRVENCDGFPARLAPPISQCCQKRFPPFSPIL